MQDMHYSSSQITVILFAPCLITYIKILIAPGGGVGMVWVSEQAKKKKPHWQPSRNLNIFYCLCLSEVVLFWVVCVWFVNLCHIYMFVYVYVRCVMCGRFVMQLRSWVLAATHTRAHTLGFSMVGIGDAALVFWTDAVGGGLDWPRRVIPWWLMNGGTDGSFVPVMELATALWEEG